MAKRFTATDIWEEDWFLEMPIEYKLFWYYMLATCDHAGLFKVNLKSFCRLNEVKLTSKAALQYFNNGKQRIREVSENLWLIEEFFVYQYGETFNANNRLHESILCLYQKNKIELTSIRGLKDLKDRVKDKDKVKEIKGIRKEGMGENLKGVKFDETKDFVFFEDGTSQKLGESQRYEAQNSKLSPSRVVKGHVY